MNSTFTPMPPRSLPPITKTGDNVGQIRRYDVRQLATSVYESRREVPAKVSVIIPLYNYATTIVECLETVVTQDLEPLALVVVDDCSTDDGGREAIAFLERNNSRFSSARVVRHIRNQGLAMSRNSGIAWSSEPYLFMLDADNRIRPPALSRLLDALHHSGAAFSYSQLHLFGDIESFGIADIWDPAKLRSGNYIDAMAMIRRDVLIAVGGYASSAVEDGWEDYDLWCRLATRDFRGVFLPEILCEYRMHGASMINRTNLQAGELTAEMTLRHPKIFLSHGSSTST
jgi:glycosyltransferase involved in cell wall biosynthesis